MEKNYASKSLTVKISNVIKMMGRGMYFGTAISSTKLNHSTDLIDFNTPFVRSWSPTSQGLYVIIHGLKGHPMSLGYPISNAIHAAELNYDVIVPKVPRGGNCSLNEAADPILALTENYVRHHAGKPIHIIAASNGCRIASYIETRLRNADVHIRITAIVGAYGGSRWVNRLAPLLSRTVLDPVIVEDLCLNSNTNSQLQADMLETVSQGSRTYEFYATANDWYIPNIDDCFPSVIADTVIYHPLKEGYDHVSLGYYMYPEILKNSLEWMAQCNNTKE